jgi:hypothetical protein
MLGIIYPAGVRGAGTYHGYWAWAAGCARLEWGMSRSRVPKCGLAHRARRLWEDFDTGVLAPNGKLVYHPVSPPSSGATWILSSGGDGCGWVALGS